jgi:phage-related protein
VERARSWSAGDCRVTRRNAYRAVYTVRFEKALYVLHAFQKKSPSGIRTAKRDVDLVEQRLNHAQRDYEEHYGKTTR